MSDARTKHVAEVLGKAADKWRASHPDAEVPMLLFAEAAARVFNNGEMFCSFCGKSQYEVRKLIAGPDVFICDECVEVCVDVIKNPNAKVEPLPVPVTEPTQPKRT